MSADEKPQPPAPASISGQGPQGPSLADQVAIGDDRHRVRQLHNLGDAGHLQRRTLVDSGELATEARALGQRRHRHPGNLDIEAIDRRAVYLGRQIDPGQRLADQTPGRTVLQRRLSRRRQGAGVRHQGSVSQAATAGRMDHRAALGMAIADRRAEARRAGPHQHVPTGRPHGSQVADVLLDRGAAARHVLAPMGEERRLNRGHLHADALPRRVEFVGENLRHASLGALAHLHLVDPHRDPAVRPDQQPVIERPGLVLRRCDHLAVAHGQRQDGRAGADEAAPRERVHALTVPWATLSAARWIAARIRA